MVSERKVIKIYQLVDWLRQVPGKYNREEAFSMIKPNYLKISKSSSNDPQKTWKRLGMLYGAVSSFENYFDVVQEAAGGSESQNLPDF
jgi:hypothetical protein